jgi:8-oxo-dGTP diphosphatase
VKRAHEPLKGQWNLPGGGVEVGETLQEACAREVLEETGLVVSVGPVIEVFDRIMRDDRGAVQYHFVLVDYLCHASGGVLRRGSDASDVVLADPAALEPFGLTDKAREVIAHALAL